MLVSREPSFVYSKGKPISSWLILKSIDIFLYKSSFILLIRDQCFVLLSPLWFHVCHFSPELMLRLHPTSSAWMPLSWTRVRQLAEARNYVFLSFKYGYFAYKSTLIRFRRPLLTPGAYWSTFLWWINSVFWTSVGLLNITPSLPL